MYRCCFQDYSSSCSSSNLFQVDVNIVQKTIQKKKTIQINKWSKKSV